MDGAATRLASRASGVSRSPAHPMAGLAGTSLKHEHVQAILAEGKREGFFEVHAENYMGSGGPPHDALTGIRRDYPVSLHGVSMSIGGPQPLDKDHLERFKALVDRYEPWLVSEHLAWSTHEQAARYADCRLQAILAESPGIAAAAIFGMDHRLVPDQLSRRRRK